MRDRLCYVTGNYHAELCLACIRIDAIAAAVREDPRVVEARSIEGALWLKSRREALAASSHTAAMIDEAWQEHAARYDEQRKHETGHR